MYLYLYLYLCLNMYLYLLVCCLSCIQHGEQFEMNFYTPLAGAYGAVATSLLYLVPRGDLLTMTFHFIFILASRAPAAAVIYLTYCRH